MCSETMSRIAWHMSSQVLSSDKNNLIWSSISLKSLKLETLESDTVLRSNARNSSRLRETFDRLRIAIKMMNNDPSNTATPPETPMIMANVLSTVAVAELVCTIGAAESVLKGRKRHTAET